VTVLAPAVASLGLLSSVLELVSPLAPFSLVELLGGFSTASTENIMLVKDDLDDLDLIQRESLYRT
jgi:hypothetical protein